MIYALAASLLDAEHERDALRRQIAEHDRQRLALLSRLEHAETTVERTRERLGREVGAC